ncbi:MAG: 16S rRNA pseudouridine(516) synthase [Akkermansiaceae bacterium]
MRLDKWVQKFKRCGKSEGRRLIASGEVLVDGEPVRDSLFDITRFHEIEISGESAQSNHAYYIMLNKPVGCVSATTDPEHQTVVDLIDEEYASVLHLAGRLDKESTGLTILTNDGQWSRLITEPDESIPKTYLVTTDKEITPETVTAFADGFYFAYEDLTTLPAELEILSSRSARVVIYEGKYHQIKRMFHAVGNRITSLHRERIGGIVLDEDLPLGSYRSLTKEEINF